MEQENIIDIEPVVEELITHIESTVDTFLETPVIETPIIETPIIETPIVETGVQEEYHIVETHIVETPIIETPVIETPIIETPIIETPVIETPIIETHIIETPVIETPVIETPVIETPVIETPIIETPIIETPVIETPIIETPVIETPVIETPVIETPVINNVQVTNNNSTWSNWFSRLFFSNKEAPIIIEKTPEKELPIMEDVSISLAEPHVSINDVAVQTTPSASGSLQIPEIKNETTVIIEETKIIKSAFILAIESVLDSIEKQEKYIIKTDDDMKILLQKLIQTKTTVFDSIEQTIKNIVSNISVDSKDIPNLMLLLVEIYEFAFQLKNKNNIIDLCGKTLKFCINVIIEEKIIQHENATDFIKNIHNLIDTGVNLIKLNKDLKKKGKGKKSFSSVVLEIFCKPTTK